MSKTQSVDIVFLVDRSGSMWAKAQDHIGGMKSLLEKQQKEDGEAFFTYILFDSENSCDIVIDRMNVQEVTPDQITLLPRGGTPLLDAVGLGISHIKSKIVTEKCGECNKETDQKVLFHIVTDGQENSSKENTFESIKNLIKSQEAAGWAFIFLGEGLDAAKQGAMIGNNAGRTASFQDVGVMYQKTSGKMSMYREMVNKGADADQCLESLSYTDQDRQDMESTSSS